MLAVKETSKFYTGAHESTYMCISVFGGVHVNIRM